MKLRSIGIGTAAAAAVLASGPAGAAPRHAGNVTRASCDRACLVSLLDRWFDALAAHSAKGLPLAKDIRFTEQASRLPIGDGLFVSTTEAPTSFKIVAADPTSGQVGAIAMIKQWGKPAEVTVRLKVVSGKITEAEQIYAVDLRPAALGNLVTPRPALLADVPATERTPRAKLYAAAFSYFDALEQDGGGLAPFADDCTRHENGLQTSTNTKPAPAPIDNAAGGNPALAKLGSLSCSPQLDTHMMQYITMIRPRHLTIVDEQKGLVLGFPRFVHRGTTRLEHLAGAAEGQTMAMSFGPNDLQASEMFKVRSGRIHEIEATGFINAYMAPTGWDDRYPEHYRYAVTHPHTHPYRAGTSFPASPEEQPSSEPFTK